MRSFNQKELSSQFKIIADHDFSFNKICIDTRQLEKGDLFVAICGKNFDGHQFIQKAVEKGAVAIVTEHEVRALKVPQIITENTILFLKEIAKKIRQEFKGKVFSLTGSSGKTTSKQMLKSILEHSGKTHATQGNLNNQIGVALTLFNLESDAKYLVTELGADCLGEIDYLADITRPNIAMITNVGSAHLEGFKSRFGIASGKSEIFNYLTQNDIAIINHDDEFYSFWQEKLVHQHFASFSLENPKATIYAKNIHQSFQSFQINYPNKEVDSITLPIAGKHNIYNALSVATMAYMAGIDQTAIKKGLESYQTISGRMQITQFKDITLIDDSYNANPESVSAAAAVIAPKKGIRILVLGDMRELGENSQQIHQDLADKIKDDADLFFCFGEQMQHFKNKVGDKAFAFDDINTLNQSLLTHIKNNHTKTTILVKGSLSMGMARVVQFLKQQLEKKGH